MEKSSGGVIFKEEKYLVLQYGLGHWGFVKGHVEKGESLTDAFLREAEEEAGLSEKELSIFFGFNERIEYYYKRKGKTTFKEVHYFLAESNTFSVRISHEHQKYKWLDFKDAIRIISFENDKNVLKKAHRFLEKNFGHDI